FFVQTNHTRKELLFLMFKEINLRNHSSLHKLFYSLIICYSFSCSFLV
ncbi:glycerophosphodiester phosphodiesterase, partial [Lactobacillus sp. UMNPBX8]